jgi:aspartate beta-hydroxylase
MAPAGRFGYSCARESGTSRDPLEVDVGIERRFLKSRPKGGKIDYHYFKSALNRYFWDHVGGDDRPVIYDIATVRPELDKVTRAFPAIRAELDALLQKRQNIPRYEEIDPGNGEIAGGPGRWSVFLLYLLGHKPEANRAQCPQTCRALEQVPHMIQAFFSILEPRTSVPLHEGPYLGYLRYHLGLRIPQIKTPRLKIGDQEHVWREGEGALLDDTWPHAVINDSDEPRAILIVDIERPMPPIPNLVNRFALNVIARHTYGRSVVRRVESQTGTA